MCEKCDRILAGMVPDDLREDVERIRDLEYETEGLPPFEQARILTQAASEVVGMPKDTAIPVGRIPGRAGVLIGRNVYGDTVLVLVTGRHQISYVPLNRNEALEVAEALLAWNGYSLRRDITRDSGK